MHQFPFAQPIYTPSMLPWNDWYHINGNTYGTWLRGDNRGWRARHHREHVVGDYKNPPPPGTYNKLHIQSQMLMTRPPVHLSPQAARIACDEFAASLLRHAITVLAVAINDHHFHTLARIPDHTPRKWIGIAKKDSARMLSDRSLVQPGGIWAVRCRCLPIRDRIHQINGFHYIKKHSTQNAVVWTYCSDPL